VEQSSLPDALEATAWTDDGEIMGLQLRTRPIHGVQFHPESIATEHGHDLLANFLDLAKVRRTAMV
jgi:anthranilate synthase component 2